MKGGITNDVFYDLGFWGGWVRILEGLPLGNHK